MPTTYRLRAPRPGPVAPPVLDETQQAVVDHVGGPLLVLAGPGTGKTTTLVEAVVDRVDNRGLRSDQVLVLTFSRKAAEELRGRITARLGRSGVAPTAMTFHSFCYALVRRFSAGREGAVPLQLMSAPEQDVRIWEAVQGSIDDGFGWPAALRPALRTRGFARELQRLMNQAHVLGLDPEALAAAGDTFGMPAWRAAGEFFETFREVMDPQGLIDYASLVRQALIEVNVPEHAEQLRREFGFVVVDEYQDTDPSQTQLLKAIAGDGRDLLAVGDPDQSIYAFRGADVGGIMRFSAEFPTRDGAAAPVVALGSTRRFGPVILAASRRITGRLAHPAGLDEETRQAFRSPRPVAPAYGDGSVEVHTFTSPAAEAEHIAEMLRRAHLDEDVPWSQMAVLLRSGMRSIPRMRRALGMAGVPVEVAGDELPLKAEPAVQVLLRALRMIDLLSRRERDKLSQREGGQTTLFAPEEVEGLLISPLGGLDVAGVRRLSRLLRYRDTIDHADERGPRPSPRLLADAIADPDVFRLVEGRDARAAARAADLLHRGVAALADGAPVETVVWDLWHDSGWERRLTRAVEVEGAAARSANRDLDALCALFDQAARAGERAQRRGLRAFLDEIDEQQIPADTLAEQGVRGDAVRLLTAHRSKGLEWRFVVVAGVQEHLWPDLRHRGSMLQTDRLARDAVREPPSLRRLLADERRVFYVAITRAMQCLVVTAVASPNQGGEQPSRFLSELLDGAELPEAEPRPLRPKTLRGVLGYLRQLAETTDHPGVRTSAAARIARLAVAGGPSGAVLAHADPDRWWGVRDLTDNAEPVRPADEPLRLSGSAVDGLVSCPLRWFLSRHAGGSTASTTAQGFGSIVHALAEAVHGGEVEADVSAMVARLDQVWDQLDFAVPWANRAERAEAEKAIARFCQWHLADRGRTAVAAEHEFSVTFDVGDDQVTLAGSMDRVEVDGAGAVVVVDFKTSKSAPTASAVGEHPQLGVYQVAVRAGAVDELVHRPGVPGGAELVQLRQEVAGSAKVQHQAAPVEGEPFLGDEQLRKVVQLVRRENFSATVGDRCSYCEFRSCCPAHAEGATIVSAGDEGTA